MSENESRNESPEPDSSTNGSEKPNEHNMMDMFATVWVKVEVEEGAESETEPHSVETTSATNCSGMYSEVGSGQADVGRRRASRGTRSNPTPKKNRMSLKCDYCDYTTPYKNCLKLHTFNHTGLKPHACSMCEFTTKSSTSLQRHIATQHKKVTTEEATTYKCDQCDYTSQYKWNLKSHKRKHGSNQQFKCVHCDYKTPYRHRLQKHSKRHRGNTIFQCDKCPFKTPFRGHISRHLAKIHNEVTETAVQCNYCDFSTITKWRLTVHTQRSKQNNVLKCPHCDFETMYMCESKRHKKTHFGELYKSKTKDIELTPEKNVPNDFDWAEQEDPNNDKAPKHKKDNKNKKYAVDPKCVDGKNIQVLESEDKNKPFQCVMCTFNSRFKAVVQRHYQRLHTDQNRPYKCVNCDFSTKTKDQIALHNKRSKSDTPIQCKECDFSTTYKCQYVSHLKCHYTYKCDKCDYTCRTRYDLQKHCIIVHSDEVYKCQYCDYKAPRKDSVLCHEAVHTGFKPFKCEHCTYMSARKTLIDVHMKKYHSDLRPNVTVVSIAKIDSLQTVERNEESNLSGFKGLLTD